MTTRLLLVVAWLVTAESFVTRQRQARSGCCHLGSQAADDVERLRESASKLRREAEELREQLNQSAPGGKRTPQETYPLTRTIVYETLPESSWTLTYRFSSDPPPKDDKDNDQSPKITNYAGRISLKFRNDGYTDLLSHEPSGTPSLSVEKVWGWDEEISNDDGLRYVSFSTTARLATDDITAPDTVKRFYWQARIDTDKSTKALSLADGTVTVKEDVQPPGGFWGVFNGGGILAQFRYVGNFGGKAS